MIRIVYLISSLRRCGPVTMLHTLVSNLDRGAFDVCMITLKDEPKDSMLADFVDLGIQVRSVSKRHSSNLLGLRRRIQDAVETSGADIVHAHGVWPSYYASRLNGIQKIVTAHNQVEKDYLPLYGPLIGRIASFVDVWAMRRSDMVVSVSNAVRSALEERFGLTSRVVPNGVDTRRYTAARKADSTEIRRQLGIPKNAFVYVHSGALIERKRPLVVARAFRIVGAGDNTVHCVFLGDGQLRPELEEAVRDMENVHLLGNVFAVEDYLSAFDCVVSGASYEGMPMAILEAVASGLSCVVSDIEPHRELFVSACTDSNGFLLIPMDDVDAFARAFQRVRTGRNGEYVVDLGVISGERMARGYSQLYRELADRRSRTAGF